MDIFLIIVTAYVLPIIFVKFLNKLSIKLFYEDLTDFTNVLEFYMPVYNIFVALTMLAVFVGTLCFEIYDECKYRLKKLDIDSIEDKLREFLR